MAWIADVPPAYHLVLAGLPSEGTGVTPSKQAAAHAHGTGASDGGSPAPAPQGASSAGAPGAGHAAHRMGTHGMVLFGAGGTLYASHIPMFRRPHDVQLLLSVTLAHPELKAGRDFSDSTYTLEPERFDLDMLVDGKLKHFKATVFQGNFEGGGTPVYRDALVKVKAVAHARRLSAEEPAHPEPRYWLLGGGRSAYLVHALSRAPDFDQVVKVSTEGPVRAKGAAPALLRLPERKNEAGTRLMPGERLTALREDGKPVRLTVERELSFLPGPDFTPPAP